MRHGKNGLLAVLSAVALLAAAGEAAAQGYGRSSAAGRIQRPTVSPYMNLFRQGNNGLPNYQTLVRPELQQQRVNTYQQGEIGQLRSQIASEQRANQVAPLPATGHESHFRFYSHFYSKKR